MGVSIDDVLKCTEFRRLGWNRFWDYSTFNFWGIPTFFEIGRMIFPKKMGEKNRDSGSPKAQVDSFFLWLAEMLGLIHWKVSSLELLQPIWVHFGYHKFLKIPQKFIYGGKKCKLIRPIEVDEFRFRQTYIDVERLIPFTSYSDLKVLCFRGIFPPIGPTKFF